MEAWLSGPRSWLEAWLAESHVINSRTTVLLAELTWTRKNRLRSIVESRKYKLEDDLRITGGDGPPNPDNVASKNQQNKITLVSGDVESAQTSHKAKKPVSSKKRKAGNDGESDTMPRKKAKVKSSPKKNAAADTMAPLATKAKQKKKKTMKKPKENVEPIEPTDLHDNDAGKQAEASKKKTKKKKRTLSQVVARDDPEDDEAEASEPGETKQGKTKKIRLDNDLGPAEGEVLVIDDE